MRHFDPEFVREPVPGMTSWVSKAPSIISIYFLLTILTIRSKITQTRLNNFYKNLSLDVPFQALLKKCCKKRSVTILAKDIMGQSYLIYA